MRKDLFVDGTGSSAGKKRTSAGGDDEDGVVEDEPIWQLSLGSIYRGNTAATSTQPLDDESGVSIAQALPVPRHSAVNSAAQAPPAPAAGAAVFGAGAEIASSLLDSAGGNGASSSVLASLAMRSSSSLHVAPAAAVNLVAHVPVPAAGAGFIATGTSPAPPPRGSPAARPAHRPVRRRIANGSPLQPATVAGGHPPAPPTNGTAIVSPVFPWATDRIGIHHPISHLTALAITTVEGEVHCSRCDARKTVSYDIASKFQEVRDFVIRNGEDMDDRAPEEWLHSTGKIPDCDGCGQRNSLRPVIPAEKERINWVFLLLGQTLGLCTLDQLKYFCAHTRQHRTGAKDRVLYSTYMELCNQLYPDKMFRISSERQKRGQKYS